MPYFFSLKRTLKMTNEESLVDNKRLATDLISKFEEIKDTQETDAFLFFNKIINPEEEFPDLHFRLEADTVHFFIIIQFWKDFICFELSSVADSEELFRVLYKYSKTINDYGFMIEHPENDDLMNLEEGIAANEKSYFEWTGIVKGVKKIVKATAPDSL